MDIQDTLTQQREILLKIKNAVMDEKQALIKNDGEALSEILKTKTALTEELDEIKRAYISEYGEVKVSEMDFPGGQKAQIQKRISDIKELHKEIREHQEINLILTRQSMAYQNTMMHIIQQAIKKSGSIYGENGKVESNEKVKTLIDQSV